MPDVPQAGFSDAVTPGPRADGHDGALCGATLKQDREDGRETCTQVAGWGTSHVGFGTCKLHGGTTPNHIAAAERQRVGQALVDAQRTYGFPLEVEPGDALLGLVRTAAGIVAWLGLQVAQLDNDGVTADGRTHPLVGLYLDERKHLAQVSRDTLAAGVAERRVRLEEAQGRLLVGFVERLIRQLGHDPMDPGVRELVREELAAIETGETQ